MSFWEITAQNGSRRCLRMALIKCSWLDVSNYRAKLAARCVQVQTEQCGNVRCSITRYI